VRQGVHDDVGTSRSDALHTSSPPPSLISSSLGPIRYRWVLRWGLYGATGAGRAPGLEDGRVGEAQQASRDLGQLVLRCGVRRRSIRRRKK